MDRRPDEPRISSLRSRGCMKLVGLGGEGLSAAEIFEE